MTEVTQRIGTYRYRILALVFMATTINYFDRSIIGVLAPTLQKLFGWDNQDYSYIIASFKIAYGIGLLFIGGIIDKIGTKMGYTLSIAIWSLFGMLHAAVRPAFSLIGFMVARFGLGIGESGNFPAAIKTVAEWFPKRDRAFATGIFDASTSVGAILAPVIVGLIVSKDGDNWQIPFLFTGLLSSLWVYLWLKTYRKPEEHHNVYNWRHVRNIHTSYDSYFCIHYGKFSYCFSYRFGYDNRMVAMEINEILGVRLK